MDDIEAEVLTETAITEKAQKRRVKKGDKVNCLQLKFDEFNVIINLARTAKPVRWIRWWGYNIRDWANGQSLTDSPINYDTTKETSIHIIYQCVLPPLVYRYKAAFCWFLHLASFKFKSTKSVPIEHVGK